jgi:tryptophanyl-tRNA synthetase
MSLRDATQKMSKSAKSDLSRINLLDTPDSILLKMQKAKTDSVGTIKYDESRPEICNLIKIYCALTSKTIEETELDFQSANTLQFKEALAYVIINKLAPIRLRTNQLLEEKSELKAMLDLGRERATKVAEETMRSVSELVGLKL